MRLGALALALAIPGLGGGVNQKNREGARLYLEGNLEEALRAFTQAQIESPDAPEIHYNIGNVHFRKGEMDKALEEYRAALRGGSEVQKRAHYNSGNVHFRKGDFPAAVEAYKEALKIDPGDLPARQNLELALRKLEEQKQQGSSKNEQGGQEDRSRQDRSEEQGGRPQEEPRQQGEPQQGAPRSMSREDAERLLAALAEMEKAEQRQQQQKRRVKVPARGKDW